MTIEELLGQGPLLQFISAGLPRVMAPMTVHSDHLIISEKGAAEENLHCIVFKDHSVNDSGPRFPKLDTIFLRSTTQEVSHDATATMALLQFISAGLPRVMAPMTVHSDHLIICE
jgi:hypothetical protein